MALGPCWRQGEGRGSKGTRAGPAGTYLSKLGHGLAGDDLIGVQPGHEAEGLKLTLTLLQLPQDQGPEDLHVLTGRGRGMGTRWRAWGLPSSPPRCSDTSLCGSRNFYLSHLT